MPAVKLEAVATPRELVVAVVEKAPAKLPSGPLVGAAKVTTMPARGLPYWSSTVACNGVAKTVPTVELWDVPAVARTVVATPTTLAEADAALLFRFGSMGEASVTDAESVNVPIAEGVATIVSVTLAVFSSVARSSVIVFPDVEGLPELAVTETIAAPEGTVSVRTTPWASLGPVLFRVTRYVTLPPRVTCEGWAVTPTPRSASSGMTLLEAEAVLFDVFESYEIVLVTDAVSVYVPMLEGVTMIVSRIEPPTVIELSLTVTTLPETEYVPAVTLIEFTGAPDGKVSVRMTPCALFGPLLVTVTR